MSPETWVYPLTLTLEGSFGRHRKTTDQTGTGGTQKGVIEQQEYRPSKQERLDGVTAKGEGCQEMFLALGFFCFCSKIGVKALC